MVDPTDPFAGIPEPDQETADAVNAWLRYPETLRNVVREAAKSMIELGVGRIPHDQPAQQCLRDFAKLAFLLVRFAEEGALAGAAAENRHGAAPN